MKKISIALFLGLVIVGCASKKKVVTKKPKPKIVITKKPRTISNPTPTPIPTPKTTPNSPVENYIAIYSDIAMEEMKSYNIPASITLAQGILESASGRGRLASEANNHFGIKCHGWQGEKIYHDDDESQECFRKYTHARQSFEDHSSFLVSRKRYSNLFRLKPDNYKAWAKGLRAAGYATDRKYPEKLISLIERYKLYEYDDKVLGNKPVILTTNIRFHKVVKGDTLYSLSKKYNTSVEALKRKNKLETDNIRIGQILKL